MENKVQPEIINKIQKLLDHHAGCLKINSEDEAISALEIAKKLIKKHHLNMMMFQENSNPDSIVDKFVDKCSVYVVPIWLYNIINIVNNICNCSCVLQKEPQSNGYIHIKVVFVSMQRDMDKIVQLYNFLKKTTYRLANAHIKQFKGNYTNWRSFSEGFTSRLLEKSRFFNETFKEKEQFDKYKTADDFNDSDFEESESESCDFDDDFEEFFDEEYDSVEERHNINKDQQKLDIQLYEYLKTVRHNINNYIRDRMSNVHYENVNRKSKVLINSYQIGRDQAEDINLQNSENRLQLSYKKHKKGKKQ